MSRALRLTLTLLLVACIQTPVPAFAAPSSADSPQADAAMSAGDAGSIGQDTTAPSTSSDVQQTTVATDGGGTGAADDSAVNSSAVPDAPQTDAVPEGEGTPVDNDTTVAVNDTAALQDDDGPHAVASAGPHVGEEQGPGKDVGTQAIVLSAAKAPTAPARSTPIYVNGSTGDDSNSGTAPTLAVKTFAKAKQLLEASGGEVIYVLGALRVSGDAGTWELDGKTLARGDGYHGELIRLAKDAVLTLKDIVLDGRGDESQTGVATGSDGGGGSLVGVYGGTLTVGEDAILQNNSIESRGHWYPEGGGAVFANNGTVNVEGGTIRNNEAVLGGGIFGINNSVINMSNGTIEGNRAIEGASTSLPISYGGNGGGICAADGTHVNLSGGTISNNSAFERGGGISMGTYYASWNYSPVLTMTGGTVSGNTAGSSGGGIFVQAGYSESGNSGTPTHAIAYITGGDITDNAMTGEGDGNKTFGGGGIYVNGYSSAYSAYRNGELYLTNVEVSGNSASSQGGGYAACPVSHTEINLTNGAAFYGNTTDSGNARELFIMASLAFGAHSGDPVYEISPSMLGGGAYRWVYDNGDEVPLNMLKGVLSAFWNQTLSLSNDLAADDAGVQKALDLAKVHITGNTSVTRGGGIGSNGTVYIGKSVDTMEIPVSKTWDDAGDKDGLRPGSVAVNLYRDGEYVGYQVVKPDANGNWSMTFKNLPANDAEGHEYVYTVEEREVTGYTAMVTGSAASGFSIINTLAVSVFGDKVWDDADDQDGMRPGAITVNLMRNGEKVDSRTVTADGGWGYRFDGLAKYDADGNAYAYTVTEDTVNGYESAIAGDAAAGFTITNSHTPEKVSISVTKKWVGSTGDGVTIHLLADGIYTDMMLVLDKMSGWTGSFTNLPKYRNGKQVSYTIAEDTVEGYSSEIEGDAANGFTVTNSKIEIPGEPSEPDPGHPVTASTPDKHGGPVLSMSSSAPASAGSLPATGDSTATPLALLAMALACIIASFATIRCRPSASKASPVRADDPQE